MKKGLIFIGLFICLSSFLSAQEFTQITAGDIVNDGGWNYACCWADLNGNGYDDLFVCNNDSDNGKHNFLYFNNGDGTFLTYTTGTVISDGNSSYGCAAADYDNDGDIDLFVSNYNENNCLYQNNGDWTFTKILTGSIVTNNGRSTGCEWIDYDKDGWLDLFVCNRDEPNFLYNNNGDGTFTRITGQPLVTESKNTGDCGWADFDENGYPDVFLANSGPDYNTCYFNNGDGTFSQLTGDPCVSDLESFDSVACGDYDNDGDMDIYTAPGMLPGSAYDLYLYQNNGDGSFVRITGLPHSGINSGGSADFIDYDYDGDLDIFHCAYDGDNIVLENDGAGNYSQITTGALATEGGYNKDPGWVDFDLDGDIDVFMAVNNYFGGDNKFFTNNGNNNSWIGIKLQGIASNNNGIDAVITISADISGQSVTQTRRLSNRNSLTEFIGLGDASIIGEIEVVWPSELVTNLQDVSVNQFLEIVEEVDLNLQNVQVDEYSGIATWEYPELPAGVMLLECRLFLDSSLIFTATSGETQYDMSALLSTGVLYTFGIEAIYNIGSSDLEEIDFTYMGTSANNSLISKFNLTNYPNPFNPITSISFNLNTPGNVCLEIINLKGQKIKTLIDEILPSGSHQICWNGTNSVNEKVSSGVYLYKLKTNNSEQTKKMILLK